MKYLLLTFVAAIALQLGAGPTARAQTTAPAAAYTGPRYPGGPDSLRALVYRSTQASAPAPAGKVLVQFDLPNGQQPNNFKLLPTTGPINIPLLNAAAASLSYLETHMAAWQPASTGAEASATGKFTNSLVLDFSTPMAAQPYAYADTQPSFPIPGRNRLPVVGGASPESLARYIQMQVRYPVEALRAQQEGRVYAYFEVAENGNLENHAIVSTAGKFLDATVLQAVRKLPAALTPALTQGKPVRIYYIMPITFAIQ
ncbi:hypothetical protein BEN47_18720 [Hymenobacter lapidarius]|uniref:TonB C-terminal domain-containing protein n=1 Tax=Hymenobacter lapidarius TaxID=1908237 RepID=A0A1G1SUA0_9BACT|nr:energy transducer TonB [Hymenobacter lapidarius]OGX82181.1 hypothetical protein BEN47_18720 [Hymenobacter lapidarius]